jgi:hypothetical protein
MFDLKNRLSGGNLADFTRAIRARKPDDFDGDFEELPIMEYAEIAVMSAREAGFFDDGQAPTDEQFYSWSYDDRVDLAGKCVRLFNEWNQRQNVSDEEKKS